MISKDKIIDRNSKIIDQNSKREEYQAKVKALQDQLDKAQGGLQAKEEGLNLSIPEAPKKGREFIDPNIEDLPMEEEACTSKVPPSTKVTKLELSQVQKEISQLIALKLEPI